MLEKLAFGVCGLILRPWRGLTDLERRRVRCVFSDSLNGSTLEVAGGVSRGSLSGGPPGGVGEWRAVTRVLDSPGQTLRRLTRSILDDLVTTAFPAVCRACGGPLMRAGFAPLCDTCLSRISLQSMTLCWRCGEALGMESDRFASHFAATEVLCTMCRLAPPPFERAVAFGSYQDEMREAVHLLKYERMSAVAKPLGAMLAKAIGTLALQGEVSVVAVPLFPAKERQRGYNQAVLLARDAMTVLRRQKSAGLTLRAEHGMLARVRDTESQYALSPRARRANLRGAFVANSSFPIGGTVLLVDDIYTTGATARECARVLRRAGAAKVFVATLSRAQAEQVERWE